MDRSNAGPLRPLLPSQQQQTPSPPLIAAGQPQATPLSGGQVTLQKRALTTAACHRCRQGKAKCDGQRPNCSRCRLKGFECTYDRAPNETPALALRREHDALKNEYARVKKNNDAMVQIFDLLKTRPQSETGFVLSLLREGIDAEDVLRQISEGDLLLQMHLKPETNFRFEFPWRAEMPSYIKRSQNPYLAAPLHEGHFSPATEGQITRQAVTMSPQYLMPLAAARVVDPRLDTIRPSLYTKVSTNDKLMRALIHDFFLFGYDWACVVQIDDFLNDMVVGRTDFCSPLLVNIILAYATHCSNAFPKRAQYWNPNTLGYRFVAEARRMWDMEFLASKPTLPSFQGGILLYLMYRLYGMDKIAASFGQEIFRCIKTLGLDSYSIPGETYSYKRSRGISVWWWFWMQSVVSYHYKELPPQNEIPAAPFPNPDLEPEFYGELHLRYPLGQILQPMHFGWSLHKTIMHGVLMHKYSTKRFAYNGTANAADVQEFADGLRGWYQTLPDVLLPERLVLPTHFKAHIHWVQTAVEVQDLLINVGLPTMDMFSPRPRTSPTAKADLLAAFETLSRFQYLRHGSEVCNSLSIQNLNILAFGALKILGAARMPGSQVPQADIDDARSTLIWAAKGLHDQSKNWYLCQTILEIVASGMAAEDLELLERFAKVKVEEDEHDPQRRIEHITAEYPLDLASPDETSVERRKLGNVLKERSQSRASNRLTAQA